MNGGLVGWWVGGLISRLVGWLVGWLISRLVGGLGIHLRQDRFLFVIPSRESRVLGEIRERE